MVAADSCLAVAFVAAVSVVVVVDDVAAAVVVVDDGVVVVAVAGSVGSEKNHESNDCH